MVKPTSRTTAKGPAPKAAKARAGSAQTPKARPAPKTSTAQAAASTTGAGGKRALPPALVANARALRKRAEARLRARGEAAVEIIKEKMQDVAENVLDMGAAAAELTVPGVPEAMGHKNFEALCEAELGVHPQTVRRWCALAAKLKRQFVLSVGLARAEVLMELCDATPADDVPEDLVDATLTLPSGEQVVVARASNEQLAAAAKAFRQARRDTKDTPGRGFSTTPAERKAHAAIATRMKKVPAHAHASTRLVAQRDGDGAKVVLEVRLPAWDATIALLAKR